ncbi:AraC family transcriptional regulator [Shewanella sp. NIFS-20-20]|uniref:helix-turn-helix transcriptional regulator n=1 Tax=Shewanella sp. NIFS-20-20 TaxID=2853806 RepID=UPI001C46A4F1|nr:AraC family transcriptional regulator [Shewanella sp. NIFS-20-20]MBV7314738.1 helix-turn-helix transcriptional regulator [Shewanella sp. NIFS-20-20]
MSVYQMTSFKSCHRQALHNVQLFAPTITWVQKGSKALWWQQQEWPLNKLHWLLSPAGQYLTFVNHPHQGEFYSRTLSLLTPPPPHMLQQSRQRQLASPMLAVSPALAWCFDTLWQLPQQALSEAAQVAFVHGLYAELAAIGALSSLFSDQHETLKHKLTRLLLSDPSGNHTLASAGERLGMSRATMTRKLAQEGEHFSDLLAQVRMNHALALLQQEQALDDVAKACGYQSESRFSARFKKQFGVTPSQYANTLMTHYG